jgi:hypothetical protein
VWEDGGRLFLLLAKSSLPALFCLMPKMLKEVQIKIEEMVIPMTKDEAEIIEANTKVKIRRYKDGALVLRQSLGDGEIGSVKFNVGMCVASGSIVVNFDKKVKDGGLGETWIINLKDIVNIIMQEKGKVDKKEAKL